MIAGFEEISSGDLFIGGKRMNDVLPRDRGISMVFQNYALYPHMTVEKNISYGLKNMKVPADEIKRKVDWAIKILGLEEYRNRKPKNLSGGQRQRVALGRAIVKDQKVFLMDEPLSNLDAKLRVSMRSEISKLHRDLGSTTIYVTHDQVEAMTMADRIVIMKDGVVQQTGAPMELYDHPVNLFVAGFIGSPQMNFFDVTLDSDGVTFKDGSRMKLTDETVKKLNDHGQKNVILGIRGEDIKFDPQNLDLYKDNTFSAVIEDTEIMGNENNLYFQFAGSKTVARVSKYEISQIGDKVSFVFMPHKLHFFDSTTEKQSNQAEGGHSMYTCQKADEYIEKNRVDRADKPEFHLTTPVGWLNDPNGFSIYKGKVHLFYQFHPYRTEWGPMHWGHSTSDDFIRWEELPTALAPDSDYDAFGCFSGTAIENDGKHVLFYTGVVEENWLMELRMLYKTSVWL